MEITIHRPTTRTRRLLVSALVATLLLTVTPPVYAHTYSGDHPGCVTLVKAHFNQGADNTGKIEFYLETRGIATAWISEGTGKHFTRWGYWSGGIWSVGGNHPTSFPHAPYLTCT